jgi:hypothetical protein
MRAATISFSPMGSDAGGNEEFPLLLTNRKLKEGEPDRTDQFFEKERLAGKEYQGGYPAAGKDSLRVELI